MNSQTDNSFPAIREGQIGSETVQTVNARDLHASLEVGRDFNTWIKGRIASFDFREHADFEIFEDLSSPNSGSSKSRSQLQKEYSVSLDMAKELAMVENNVVGRRVRRHFIACERLLKESVRAGSLELDVEARRAIGGIVKGIVHREVADLLPTMVASAIAADPRAVATEFKPALTVLIDGKVPAKKRRAFSQKVSSRLRRFSAEHKFPLRTSRETGRYLFHSDAVANWLQFEGNRLISEHVAALSGQGNLHLFPKRTKRP